MTDTVLNITRSILGQPWRWRALAADARDPGFQPDDLVTQLLLARGVARDDLDANRTPSIRGFMPDPSIFNDMDKAARRLADAVLAGEAVTVFGDYDVDGATSAALMIRLLRGLGLDPQAYIPDRLMEGYGPSGEALVRIAQGGATLIVTVDCGAQAFEALDMARDAGVDVIVVDHHQCATALPHALALVNPNRLDETGGQAARPSRRSRRRVPARRGVAARIARARFLRGPRRTQAARPARPRRARHRRRCGAVEGPQPRVRRTGPQGHGAAPQCRPDRACRSRAADARADLQRSGLRARAEDQRRRPCRARRSRRAVADDRRPARSAHDRRRTRPSQRGAPRDRGCGPAGSREPAVRRSGRGGRGQGLASRRDRYRRRSAEGTTGHPAFWSSRSTSMASARDRGDRFRASISARRSLRRKKPDCSSRAAGTRWRRG